MFDVIIPIYQTKYDFLKECLNSLINQTYENWNCYIVDGSSETWEGYSKQTEYIDSLLEQDNRINYYREIGERGISNARNQAISYGNNEYIMFLDSDDYLYENHLATMMNEINDKNICYYCRLDNTHRIEHDTVFREITQEFNRYNFAPFIPDFLMGLFHTYYPIYPTGTIVKREEFERVKGFDKDWIILEDVEFFARLLGVYKSTEYLYGSKFVDFLGGYRRIHDEQITQKVQGVELKKKFNSLYPFPDRDECPSQVSPTFWNWFIDILESRKRSYITKDVLIQKESEWSHLLENGDEDLDVSRWVL